MDGGLAPYSPRTVEEIFRDFKGRRAAMIKALTADAEEFYQQCDPVKENLCLYGFPNERWEVNLPAEEVPPELPEPALGINFARDAMTQKDWLSLVAVHSDAWLVSVAFYFGARFKHDKNERKRLFGLINDLPTIHEFVTGKNRARTLCTPEGSIKAAKPILNAQWGSELHAKNSKIVDLKEESEEDDPDVDDGDDNGGGEDEHGETFCGSCGESSGVGLFWICCDVCERWFHGKCVKITSARAAHIKRYKCPSCTRAATFKRARTS